MKNIQSYAYAASVLPDTLSQSPTFKPDSSEVTPGFFVLQLTKCFRSLVGRTNADSCLSSQAKIPKCTEFK